MRTNWAEGEPWNSTEVNALAGELNSVSKMIMSHDFTTKADDASLNGDLFDTGQTMVDYSPSVALGRISRTSLGDGTGRHTTADTTNGSVADYLGLNFGSVCNYIEADFNFSSAGSTTGQCFAMVLSEENLETGLASDIHSPMHVVFASGYYEMAYFNGPSLVSLGIVIYDVAFTTQTQHVEVFVDKVNSRIYCRDPNGTVNTFSDPVVGTLNPTWATWELFYTNASTDKRIEGQRYAASNLSPFRLSNSADRAQQLRNDGRALREKLSGIVSKTSTQTLASSTTETDLISTSLPGRTLEVGTTYRITLRGTIRANAASTTCTFRIYVGTVVSTETYVWTSGAAVGPVAFWLIMDATVRTAGAGGTYISNGFGQVANAATTINNITTTTTTTAAVNTTTITTVKASAQWSASNANNSLVVTVATIEQVV